MADVRPFRALRYDPARTDPAKAIAPPYDVISASQQDELYRRSPHNIVRIEYGLRRPDDGPSSNRYTRAQMDLAAWRRDRVLLRDDLPGIYHYRLLFEWNSKTYERSHYFAAVRLEEWEKGVIRPHERTLSAPKADRLDLLRATRTQVSPVYCLSRERLPAGPPEAHGRPLYDVSTDGHRHVLSAITDHAALGALCDRFANADFYIADGHHRYETALAYRDECRSQRKTWTGEEPENFVLMAVTDAADPGLLVLATHRLVHRPVERAALSRLGQAFDVLDLPASQGSAAYIRRLGEASSDGGSCLVAIGLEPNRVQLLRLRERGVVESTMPPAESGAWKRLDVNVLQYGVLQPFFGIDEAALSAGGAVTYTQDADEALRAVRAGDATCAFLLAATPVEQVIAVSDANGRMPQKSTYFYPKLPTGLVLNALD